MLTITDEMVERALNATTDELPEGLQYVLIRGLSAMGWQMPADGSQEVMRAALTAALEGREEPDIARIRAEAVAEERERCARVAETRMHNHAARNVWTRTNGGPPISSLAYEQEARDIAAAIRGGDDGPR